MATTDSLITFTPNSGTPPDWLYVEFTSGGTTTPVAGDVIYGDTSTASATVEVVHLLSTGGGSWAGGDAAGFFFLSNDAGNAWTSAENFTIGSDAVSNHGTITATPSAGYATLDTRNSSLVIDFDGDDSEAYWFTGVMPRHYAGTTGVTVTIGWSATSATSGNTYWAGAFKSFTSDTDDLDTKNFAAVNLSASTAASAAGELIYDTITFTDGADMDSVAIGEYFHLLIARFSHDPLDTMNATDAEIVSVEISET